MKLKLLLFSIILSFGICQAQIPYQEKQIEDMSAKIEHIKFHLAKAGNYYSQSNLYSITSFGLIATSLYMGIDKKDYTTMKVTAGLCTAFALASWICELKAKSHIKQAGE